MTEDIKLFETLQLLAKQNEVNVIIESGTYLGTGSTMVLAKAFSDSTNFEKLYTCEVNFNFFKKAKENLRNFSKVICLYGRTISFKEAREFILSDSVLLDHSAFPEVFIDDTEEPVKFYLNELEGSLGGSKKLNLLARFKKLFTPFKEDLLKKTILKNFNKTLLIVLDSAGGIGYLEFLTIQNLLKDKDYYILLDDIHHLKHFRSFDFINKDDHFKMIDHDISNGWALAKHSTNFSS